MKFQQSLLKLISITLFSSMLLACGMFENTEDQDNDRTTIIERNKDDRHDDKDDDDRKDGKDRDDDRKERDRDDKDDDRDDDDDRGKGKKDD